MSELDKIDRFCFTYLTKIQFWCFLAHILSESECGESYAISISLGVQRKGIIFSTGAHPSSKAKLLSVFLKLFYSVVDLQTYYNICLQL